MYVALAVGYGAGGKADSGNTNPVGRSGSCGTAKTLIITIPKDAKIACTVGAGGAALTGTDAGAGHSGVIAIQEV